LESFNKAIAIDLNKDIRLDGKGIAPLQLGGYQEALDSYNKAISIDLSNQQNKYAALKLMGSSPLHTPTIMPITIMSKGVTSLPLPTPPIQNNSSRNNVHSISASVFNASKLLANIYSQPTLLGSNNLIEANQIFSNTQDENKEPIQM
jgi:tetratricopeptide (TPR) repeat protein